MDFLSNGIAVKGAQQKQCRIYRRLRTKPANLKFPCYMLV